MDKKIRNTNDSKISTLKNNNKHGNTYPIRNVGYYTSPPPRPHTTPRPPPHKTSSTPPRPPKTSTHRTLKTSTPSPPTTPLPPRLPTTPRPPKTSTPHPRLLASPPTPPRPPPPRPPTTPPRPPSISSSSHQPSRQDQTIENTINTTRKNINIGKILLRNWKFNPLNRFNKKYKDDTEIKINKTFEYICNAFYYFNQPGNHVTDLQNKQIDILKTEYNKLINLKQPTFTCNSIKGGKKMKTNPSKLSSKDKIKHLHNQSKRRSSKDKIKKSKRNNYIK